VDYGSVIGDLYDHYFECYQNDEIASLLTAVSMDCIRREDERLSEIAERLEERFDPTLYALFYVA